MDEAELIETNKETEKTSKVEVLRDEKGRLVKGYPNAHRPKGALSRYTELKAQAFKAFKVGKGYEWMLHIWQNGSDRLKMDLLKVTFDLIPKETKIDADLTVGPRIVIIRAGEEIKLEKENQQGE